MEIPEVGCKCLIISKAMVMVMVLATAPRQYSVWRMEYGEYSWSTEYSRRRSSRTTVCSALVLPCASETNGKCGRMKLLLGEALAVSGLLSGGSGIMNGRDDNMGRGVT